MLRSGSFQFFLSSFCSVLVTFHYLSTLRCALCEKVAVDSRSFHKVNPFKFLSASLFCLHKRGEREKEKKDSVASVATGKKGLSPPLPKGSALRVFDGESVAQSDAFRRASCEKALTFRSFSSSPTHLWFAEGCAKQLRRREDTRCDANDKIKKYGSHQASASERVNRVLVVRETFVFLTVQKESPLFLFLKIGDRQVTVALVTDQPDSGALLFFFLLLVPHKKVSLSERGREALRLCRVYSSPPPPWCCFSFYYNKTSCFSCDLHQKATLIVKLWAPSRGPWLFRESPCRWIQTASSVASTKCAA